MARAAEDGRIPAQTDEVDDGGTVTVGSLKGRVIGIPAHTNGHVAYHFPQLDAVFTGDTLFIAGCGRVFEGKANTMVESLSKLAKLPDSTKVYCGHEYTEKNLQFALTLEPNNAALKAKNDWVVKARAAGQFHGPLDHRRRETVQSVPPHRQRRAARESQETRSVDRR